jgi:hypothetical protein
MSDWFTGSGCVLLKILIWEVFGILPDLNGLAIRPAAYFPTNEASISMIVKGCEVSVLYRNQGKDKRSFIVNGKARDSVYDEKAKTEKIYFTNEELKQGKLIIEVLD